MNSKSKPSVKNKVVAIIGLGYVGLPLALLTNKRGYKVIGIDIDKELIKKINNGISPILNKKNEKALHETKITASNDYDLTKKANIIIVCVPTPVNDSKQPDFKPLIESCKEIGKRLNKGQLIILESTVNPGAIKEIVVPVLEKYSGLTVNKDFHVSHCPERIDPGSSKWDVENIPRVIGSLDKAGLTQTKIFYKSILNAPLKTMDTIEEAEAVKIFENSFRDVNIAFVNEFAISFSKFGINILNVIEGASTKPFAFLPHYPGCGVGGHCVPVDPYYMIDYAKRNGFNHALLALARKINNNMPKYTVEITVDALKKSKIQIQKATVAVLGLAYKKGVVDTRESPSYIIIDLLKKRGLKVKIYDSKVSMKSSSKTLLDAMRGVSAVIIATDHDEFRTLKPKYFLSNGIKIIIDGRNCLNKEEFIKSGIYYRGIGV